MGGSRVASPKPGGVPHARRDDRIIGPFRLLRPTRPRQRVSCHDNTVVARLSGSRYARLVRPATYDQVLRTVARRVRAARLKLGFSQEEAAHRAGIPSRQWQRVEAARPLTLRTLVAVAAALESEVSDLLDRR